MNCAVAVAKDWCGNDVESVSDTTKKLRASEHLISQVYEDNCGLKQVVVDLK